MTWVVSPAISLCVASRGDPQRLRALFDSLRHVRLPQPAELVLVLNTPEPPDLARWYPQDCGFQLVPLVEPVRGKSRSLNRAMQHARGELLVFTDDDVVHDPDWLVRLWDAAGRYPEVAVFGGTIHAEGAAPSWIERSVNLQGLLLCQHAWSSMTTCYPAGHYPMGPNLAVRRVAALGAGARWNEAMGPGTGLPVGDETDFLSQLSRPGAADRLFVAEAVVTHAVDARYCTLAGALRRMFQGGWAAGRFHACRGPISAAPVTAQIVDRLRNIRSGRELACNVARSCGFFLGRYLPSGSAR